MLIIAQTGMLKIKYSQCIIMKSLSMMLVLLIIPETHTHRPYLKGSAGTNTEGGGGEEGGE